MPQQHSIFCTSTVVLNMCCFAVLLELQKVELVNGDSLRKKACKHWHKISQPRNTNSWCLHCLVLVCPSLHTVVTCLKEPWKWMAVPTQKVNDLNTVSIAGIYLLNVSYVGTTTPLQGRAPCYSSYRMSLYIQLILCWVRKNYHSLH